MNSWRQFPLIRLIITFLLGITLGSGIAMIFRIPVLVYPVCYLPAFLSCVFSRRWLSYRRRWIPGLLVFLFLIIAGCGYQAENIRSWHNSNIPVGDGNKKLFIAAVSEPVVEKPRSMKTIIEVVAYRGQGRWNSIKLKSLVYFEKSGQSQRLCYGDRIVFYAALGEPPGPGNPGAFNYRQYLAGKGINYSVFIGKGRLAVLGRDQGNPLFSIAMGTRNKLLGIFKRYSLTGKEFAVAGALLLGYVDEIDNETIKDYSVTGAMHILSVSGMHVGIIFLVLDRVLAFLNKRKKGLVIKAILIIVFIWFYALLTGLSPAVLRAAVMLSLIVTGKSMKRHPDILNILAASAMGLLIYDPKLLADTGFQLSYLAVAGIVILNKPIYGLFQSGNWLADKIWALLAVSISAQLATMPVGLWYFHQFPNYFMVTNLVVVPLSSIIIYSGIALLFLSFIPVIATLLGKMLVVQVRLLNGAIHLIGTIPGSSTKGIYLSLAGTILLYLLIILIFRYVSAKRKWQLYAALLACFFLCSDILVHRINNLRQSRFIVYQLKRGLVLDFISGNRSILAGDIRIIQDPLFSDVLGKNRSASGMREKYRIQYIPGTEKKTFNDSGRFIMHSSYFLFMNKRIGIIHSPMCWGPGPKIKLDYLVIYGNILASPAVVLSRFYGYVLIIDETNTAIMERRWRNEAVRLKRPFYSVRQSGAFIADF